MGTTVTPNLALIKPDSDEYIKEALPTFAGWAAQNSANMDKLDTLFRVSTHTWAPSWTASSVNPTYGAGGTIEGDYVRMFPRMVVGYIKLFVGDAGFLAGTGTYSLTPPVAIAAELDTFNTELPIGKACLYDFSSLATSTIFTVLYNTAGNNLQFQLSTNDLWTAASPVALGQGDRMSCYFMYPTSVA